MPAYDLKHLLIRVAYTVALFLGMVHIAMQLLLLSNIPSNSIYDNPYLSLTLSSVAQTKSINVYNAGDIVQGSNYIVLAEVNPDDELIRLVPTTDIYGGRLDYQRNDFMVYKVTIVWQRLSERNKFDFENNTVPLPTTHLIHQQILLDSCLQNNISSRPYLAFLFRTPVEQREYYRAYVSEPILEAVIEYQLDNEDLQQIEAMNTTFGIGCYNLPPNHFASNSRAEQSLTTLESIYEEFRQDGGTPIVMTDG